MADRIERRKVLLLDGVPTPADFARQRKACTPDYDLATNILTGTQYLLINGVVSEVSAGGGPSPSTTVVAETASGSSSAAGVAATFSRGDHTHGTPTDPVPAHVAAGDPHPAYALDADLTAHVGAVDPHSTYALDADLTAHAGAADPHPAYALDTDLSAHVAAADPHTGYQRESEKDAASGYAGLSAGSKLAGAQQTYGSGVNTACEGNDARLSDARTPLSHTHGNITNGGLIGVTTDLPIITGTGGILQAGAFGTGANTFCQGNDARLADDRTASGIRTATTLVVASAAAAPTAGQVLTAIGGTSASWQTPAGGASPLGVLSDLQFSLLQSDGTLNAALGVQTWAGTNKTGQDVFTVEANTTYRVRGRWIMNTGATTHTTAMAWALATATVTDFQYLVHLWSAALNAIATVQSTTHVSGVASKVLNATSTAVYTIIEFEGILVIGTGGAITPQINFSANPTGTNLMKRGSWTSFEKLGSDTVTQVGSGWA